MQPCVQVTHILRLPGDATLQILHGTYCNIFERPLLVRSSSVPILNASCTVRDLQRIHHRHAAIFDITPDALLPLAIQSINPESVRRRRLHCPHMDDCYDPPLSQPRPRFLISAPSPSTPPAGLQEQPVA